MRLHELLTEGRDDLIERWADKVRTRFAAEEMPHLELLDSMPFFLDALVLELRRRVGLTALPAEEVHAVAAEHGLQRYHLGVDLIEMVREYGLLHECILTLSAEQDAVLGLEDHIFLATYLNQGAVDAVTAYSRHRDEELRKQAGQHIAFLSHELRNPLGSARIAVDLLKQEPAAPLPIVSVLVRSLDRLRDLIDHTLVASRMSAAPTPLRALVNLRGLLGSACDECEAEAHARAIGVTLEVDEGLAFEVDERLLRSVITNLVRNAIKFSPRESSVTVTGRQQEGRILISVGDSCGGVEDGFAEKVFAPFVQVGRDKTGFGLGLAIAKQAAEAHGGVIHVHNHPGKGCVFVVDLPVFAASA